MKIGIDVREAANPKDGKSWYTWHLVRELLQMDKENEYILYTNRLTDALAQMTKNTINSKASYRLLPTAYRLFYHLSVIRDFKKQKGDVFFSPTSFLIPALLPKSIASVIVVFDLVAFLWRKWHQTKATIIERLFLPWAIKKARHIIVPSENTRKDCEKFFPKSIGKTTLTLLAANKEFFATASPEELQRVKSAHHLPEKFILTVGTLEPRKNLLLLLEVFSQLPEKFKHIQLVVIGGKGWKSEKLTEKLKDLQNRVHLISFCSQEYLPIIYQAATVFVFPSLYEGFGFPPLEAMASGCPVICSNAGSLPEVVGRAALLFDPHDKKTLQQHLENILEDSALRKNISALGHVQAKKFSWEDTAKKTFRQLVTPAANQQAL